MSNMFLRLAIFIPIFATITYAEPTQLPTPATVTHTIPVLNVIPPNVNAKAYILLDVNSNKTLASQNADTRLPPASLTKMMTSYVISKNLQEGRIHMDDLVTISEKAAHMGGSKMFIKAGEKIPVHSLLQGIIVD